MRKGFAEPSAQYQAVIKNRRALKARAMTRFEVRALESDKDLIRDIAKRLAAEGQAAEALRAELTAKSASEKDERGGVWRWLRASPLVGSGVKLKREKVRLRKIDL